ncbi:hypothetical protein [Laribacter hongkongensis]|uniref:hypothetical protein n=1 Tax=Laribacter hongkongensis TaxID=168471 RepID=UPI001EFC5728|nr:hypothetical protein [Laribacter hongkongensis]MCG9082885.1 hypothetical protein [Laribacter hongkongensis]
MFPYFDNIGNMETLQNRTLEHQYGGPAFTTLAQERTRKPLLRGTGDLEVALATWNRFSDDTCCTARLMQIKQIVKLFDVHTVWMTFSRPGQTRSNEHLAAFLRLFFWE